jgi:hypothetical protein
MDQGRLRNRRGCTLVTDASVFRSHWHALRAKRTQVSFQIGFIASPAKAAPTLSIWGTARRAFSTTMRAKPSRSAQNCEN